MKHPLKIAINVLTSLFVMVLGTIQAVQAQEVWLDFSVPEADTVQASPAVTNNPQAASKAIQPSLRNSDNTVKPIELNFGVPNPDSAPVPVVPRLSNDAKPSKLTPPPKAKNPPTKKPLLPPPATSKPITRSKQLTALRRAIIGQESAGKFWLVNPDSGALGYGQLLKENVAPWTKAALGRALTPDEFLANPDAQIKTIDHKLNEYLNRELAYTGGSNEALAIRRVASAWYSGNPNLWSDTHPQYSKGRRYPSIESYTYSVWVRYLREIDNG